PKVVIRGYNKDGQVLWTKFRIYTAFFQIDHIVCAPDAFGNFYVSYMEKDFTDPADVVTVKYDSQGQEVWTRTLDFSANSDDYPTAIAVDYAGNPAIALTTSSRIGVVRYRKDGYLLFRHAYGGINNNGFASHVAYDSDRNIISGGRYLDDTVVFKITPTGARVWAKALGYPGSHPTLRTLNVTSSNEVIVSRSSGVSSSRNRFMRLSSAGTIVWNIVAPPDNSWDDAYIQPNGNWISLTAGICANGVNYGILARAYNMMGAIQWSRESHIDPYESLGSQEGQQFATVMDHYGDVYYACSVGDFAFEHYLTGKMSSSGVFKWRHFHQWSEEWSAVSDIAYRKDSGDIFTFGEFTMRTSDAFQGICYKQSVQANQESYSVPRNLTFNSPKSVFWNDRYAGDATANLAFAAQHGSVTVSPTGYFSYTPQAGYTGPDTFTYRAMKAGVDSSLAVVNITVL
ncbi:MAG: Ig-like domain-containing protein, partial [Fimbriimonadaceae bacterium]